MQSKFLLIIVVLVFPFIAYAQDNIDNEGELGNNIGVGCFKHENS